MEPAWRCGARQLLAADLDHGLLERGRDLGHPHRRAHSGALLVVHVLGLEVLEAGHRELLVADLSVERLRWPLQ
eukprot:5263936-Pyramimonas_sp.AAC.1